jgi:hypothetical protein
MAKPKKKETTIRSRTRGELRKQDYLSTGAYYATGEPTVVTKKNIYAEIGIPALKQFGGILAEEWVEELRGQRGIRAYKTMVDSDATVFAALNMVTMAVRQVPFWINAAGDTDADSLAQDFATDCLFKDMENSWQAYLDEFVTFIKFGFDVHEIVYKLRMGPDQKDPSRRSLYNDGKIGFRKFAMRPQESLFKWDIDPQTHEVKGMIQLNPAGAGVYYVPLDKAVHFAYRSTKGNPEGSSVLRGAYSAYYKKHKLEEFELIGLERNLAGIPIVRIPISELQADDNQETVDRYMQMGEDVYRNEDAFFLLPSDTFEGTSIPMYAIELVGNQQPVPELPTTAPIERYQGEIVRVFLADILLLGNATGSWALAKEKSNFFVMFISSVCDLICEVINKQALAKLFKLNTWEGLSGIPELVHGDVTETDVAEIGMLLLNLMRAGAQVFPNDDLLDSIYDEAGLPRTGVPTREPEISATEQNEEQPPAKGTQTQAQTQKQTIAKRRQKLAGALVQGVGPAKKAKKMNKGGRRNAR